MSKHDGVSRIALQPSRRLPLWLAIPPALATLSTTYWAYTHHIGWIWLAILTASLAALAWGWWRARCRMASTIPAGLLLTSDGIILLEHDVYADIGALAQPSADSIVQTGYVSLHLVWPDKTTPTTRLRLLPDMCTDADWRALQRWLRWQAPKIAV